METLHLRIEILLGVEDGFIHAMFARDLSFFCCRNGAEDMRAEHLGHLHDQPAGAARGRMHQARFAALQRIGRMRQVVLAVMPCSMAAAAMLKSRPSRYLDQLRGWDHRIFGIRSARHGVSYAIAGRDFGDIGTNRFHRPRCLAARNQRQIGLIEAGAEIGNR